MLDKGTIIYDGEKQKFKDTYGKYIFAELVVNNKNISLSENMKTSSFEIIEETDTNIKIRFSHEKTTIMQIMNEISKYCVVEDIHMRESELEDILKEIYKGARKC